MMHLVRLAFAALWIVCGLTPASHAQPPKPRPRIAIIPGDEDKGANALADLLTAAMSQGSDGYEIVERAELNRIAQEAEVQALLAAERPRALARLAKADGLIILAAEPSGPGHRTISARLSSTATGLIVKTFVLAADDVELPTSAKLAADALRFAAGRLRRAGSAPAQVVSLLGIRANASSSPGVAIETALNAAITHHLSGIPGLAVVERWKLDDVAFERSLSEKDMPALTTGTLLVDGSLDVREKVASVKLRIRKTQEEAGKILAIESPADDALLLARNIATKVAAECGNNTAPLSLDPKAEATAYAKLGGWLLNHRMGREAAQAYESAVALGDNGSETLLKRIYAYADAAHSRGVIGGSIGFNESSAFDTYRRELEANSQRFPFVLASVNRATAYAETLLHEPWQPYAGCVWKAEFGFTTHLAIMASRTLVSAHRLHLHVEHPAEVAGLRKRTEVLVRRNQKERERHGDYTYYALEVLAGYWSATPEKAAEYWQDLLRSEDGRTPWQRQVNRSGIANALEVEGFGLTHAIRPGTPAEPPRSPLVDWSTQDNARGTASWKMLLNKLRASESFISQFDGIALGIYTTQRGEEHDKLLFSMLDLFEHHRESLTKPEGRAVFFSFTAPAPYHFDGLPQGFPERYASLLETIFAGSGTVEMEGVERARTMCALFNRASRRDTPWLTKECAEKLVFALEADAARASTTRRATSGNDSWESRHAAALEGIYAMIIQAYPILKRPVRDQPLATAADSDAIAVGLLTSAKATAPKDRRYWVHSGKVDSSGERFVADHPRPSETGYISVDQNLKITEIPPVPETLFQEPHDYLFLPWQTPLAMKDGVMSISYFGVLLRYDFQGQKWSDETGLLPEHLRNTYAKHKASGSKMAYEYVRPRVGMINDTLYVATADDGHSIGRITKGQYQLITSSRRRPAEHSVDELPPASVDAMFPGAEGRPYVLLGMRDHSEVHDLERGKKVATFEMQSKVRFDGKAAVIANYFTVAVIAPGPEKPRCLMRIPRSSLPPGRLIHDDSLGEAIWTWPSILSPDQSAPIVHGDSLFFMKNSHGASEQAGSILHSGSAGKLTLLCFKPERKEPLEIPLNFNPEALSPFFDFPPAEGQLTMNVRDLWVTSAGMFFLAGMRNPLFASSDHSSPGLLYITWKQVNEWLVRHGHARIRSDGTPGTVKPVR